MFLSFLIFEIFIFQILKKLKTFPKIIVKRTLSMFGMFLKSIFNSQIKTLKIKTFPIKTLFASFQDS